jgi:hypothetical protein
MNECHEDAMHTHYVENVNVLHIKKLSCDVRFFSLFTQRGMITEIWGWPRPREVTLALAFPCGQLHHVHVSLCDEIWRIKPRLYCTNIGKGIQKNRISAVILGIWLQVSATRGKSQNGVVKKMGVGKNKKMMAGLHVYNSLYSVTFK